MASIHQKRGHWQVQWFDPATQKRRSRTFSNRDIAERFAASRENDRDLVRAGLTTARQVSERRYPVTIDELCDQFMEFAKGYYRKPDGRQTSTLSKCRFYLDPLRRLYGPTAAVDFGPQALKALREAMVAAGWSRSTVNDGINLIRQVFRWGVEQEDVPASILEGLRAVAPLRRGRSKAKESEPVRPVPAAHIRAVRRHVGRQTWAMIELQRLTGMRPGEVVSMRGCDLDTVGKVWAYTPAAHKTEHYDQERVVYLGPRAQAIVGPFLRRDLGAYLFSPRDAEKERHAAAQTHRRPDQQPTPRETGRRVGACYTVASYRRAIHRACESVNVPSWKPNQLRHNAATRIRREYGIEMAQTVLGHRLGSNVTEVYAEANVKRAREIIARVG